MPRRRWDTDTRGHGVASAAELVPGLDRLRAAMCEPDWVAEEPEAHLLPHICALCDERGWTVRNASAEDGVLLVELEVPGGSRRDLQAAAFAAFGTFAEPSSFAAQREVNGAFELELATGVLEGDGFFAPHGHTVQLRVLPGPSA